MFSMWNALENWLSEYLIDLQKLGFFLNFSVVRNGESSTFQFSSNDPEILELFIGWYNERNQKTETPLRLENFEKKQQAIKEQLLAFITNDPDLAIAGKEESLELLKMHRLKFLKY